MQRKKVAAVIGGGQTLGEFLSKGLAEYGYQVAVADVNYEQAQRVSSEIRAEGLDAQGFYVDACSQVSVIDFANKIKEQYGCADLMVYNAGVARAAMITETSLSDFNHSLAVNLTGYFLCARELSKLMIQQRVSGNIIQINSKSGKVGSKHNSSYSAAKFAGVGLTQSLALDLAKSNIRVNCLMLGNLLTSPMFQSLIPQYAKKLGISEAEVEQAYIDKVPLGRGCEYQDVLDVLLFYASEKASYLTGQAINITGGQVMF